jgi:uncharacterized protein YcbX
MSGSRTVGRVEAVFRYPVKSMAGESLESVEVGWHGIVGDRRFALRRVGERAGMPWLTASKFPDLLRYTPLLRDGAVRATHVRTPDGRELPVDSDELVAELAGRYEQPVELMRLDHGIFDETPLSLLTDATVGVIGAACGRELGVRRFRPNVYIRTEQPPRFEEDAWLGSVVVFGDDELAVSITHRDERCAMLNLDPDSAQSDPAVLKAAVRLNDNNAGVYATVIRCGRLAVGQRVTIDR